MADGEQDYDTGGREVDVWTTDAGYYIRAAAWKRAQGPLKNFPAAIVAVNVDVPFPFAINYCDPREVPKDNWPITRQRKVKDDTHVEE